MKKYVLVSTKKELSSHQEINKQVFYNFDEAINFAIKEAKLNQIQIKQTNAILSDNKTYRVELNRTEDKFLLFHFLDDVTYYAKIFIEELDEVTIEDLAKESKKFFFRIEEFFNPYNFEALLQKQFKEQNKDFTYYHTNNSLFIVTKIKSKSSIEVNIETHKSLLASITINKKDNVLSCDILENLGNEVYSDLLELTFILDSLKFNLDNIVSVSLEKLIRG